MRKITSMPFYIGLEEMKEYVGLETDTRNNRFAMLVGASSRFVEKWTGREFYPVTEQRKFDWQSNSWLEFELEDCLSISAILDENGEGTVDIANLFYEPANDPPYVRIFVDPTLDYFTYGSFKEQAIHITGDWGYTNSTVVTGATVQDNPLSDSATSLSVDDGSKIDIGWLLLIGTERIFVEDVTVVDSAVNANAAIDNFAQAIGVATPSSFNEGEIIRIDDEDMKVLKINTSTLTVIRGYNGTSIESHNSGDDVYAYRTYTISRGVFGSTAAAHLQNAVINRYTPPDEIIQAVGALTARAHKRSDSAWADTVGGGSAGTNIYKKEMPAEIASSLLQFKRFLAGDI